MKNFVSQGNTLTFTAGANIASGAGVLLGALFGVAAGAIAMGQEGVLNLTGVFELPKAPSQAWTLGQAIYWDDAEKRCTNVGEGNVLIGTAFAPVADGAADTLGLVRLNAAYGQVTFTLPAFDPIADEGKVLKIVSGELAWAEDETGET